MARICLGQVVAAHGIRGLVRVRCFTERPESLTAYGPLSDEGGGRYFRLQLRGPAKDGVLAAVEGVGDRTAAEALRGLRLYVERAALPKTVAEEYYHADLVGLQAVLDDGTALGPVVAVHDFGGGDMIEVAQAEGGGNLVYPFTRAVVPVVDVAAGRLVIVPPGEIVAAGPGHAAAGGASGGTETEDE